MKKLFTLITILLIFFSAYGQEEKSVVIDQKSFRPVQSDALTGYAVDEIGLDSSRRPCARLKVKVNRMTKAEINQISVKIATNNQLTKCKTADYDNGLIIEMTAKPQSRFYFSHPEFGDSNEVQLDLEPNKEYYIEAYLNQSFSIVVNSNVEGADIYLDDIYKGQTDGNWFLTISEVMIGDHTLRVEYSKRKYEQKIVVSKSNILFRQDVNTSVSQQQTTAKIVQSPTVPTTEGRYKLGDLYNENGKQGVVFEVDSSGKFGKLICLKENEKESEDWHYATTAELKKFVIDKSILSAVNRTLEIYGEPISDRAYIPSDMRKEWRSTNHIGDRDSYRHIYHYVYNHKMTNSASRNPNPPKGNSRAVCSFGGGETRAPYAVGDYYCEGGKEGVVFEVSADGMHGKIVWGAMAAFWQYKGTKAALIGATDRADGAKNTQKIKSLEGWESAYWGVVACADKGSGWYMPAIDEVKRINANRERINATFDMVGLYADNKKFAERKLKEYSSTTSTEADKKKIWTVGADNNIAQSPKISKNRQIIFPVSRF